MCLASKFCFADESQAFQEAQVPVNPVENLAGKSKFSCEICQKVFARKDCLVQVNVVFIKLKYLGLDYSVRLKENSH